jgi:hypothetical protein
MLTVAFSAKFGNGKNRPSRNFLKSVVGGGLANTDFAKDSVGTLPTPTYLQADWVGWVGLEWTLVGWIGLELISYTLSDINARLVEKEGEGAMGKGND